MGTRNFFFFYFIDVGTSTNYWTISDPVCELPPPAEGQVDFSGWQEFADEETEGQTKEDPTQGEVHTSFFISINLPDPYHAICFANLHQILRVGEKKVWKRLLPD